MMLIPRGNYGLNLLDDFFNDPFFTSSGEKQETAGKMPIMRTSWKRTATIFWKLSCPDTVKKRSRLS